MLLCWTAVVLRQLQPQSAKKAVLKLVECQVLMCILDIQQKGCLPQPCTMIPASHHVQHMLLQAVYLDRLQSRPASKQNMLKVTDRLLATKPELLPEYVEVAKSKGTRSISIPQSAPQA